MTDFLLIQTRLWRLFAMLVHAFRSPTSIIRNSYAHIPSHPSQVSSQLLRLRSYSCVSHMTCYYPGRALRLHSCIMLVHSVLFAFAVMYNCFATYVMTLYYAQTLSSSDHGAGSQTMRDVRDVTDQRQAWIFFSVSVSESGVGAGWGGGLDCLRNGFLCLLSATGCDKGRELSGGGTV